jgi:hypothetical protein
MGSDTGLGEEIRCHHRRWFSDGLVGCCLVRLHIFLVLSQVTFFSGNRLWKMLANECESESRPSGEETSIDSLHPSLMTGLKHARSKIAQGWEVFSYFVRC